ncbi:hypothetical protein J4437_05215 [Candidatus Woesearchaeota archaeon]|nr:hypothetical protein [Candidatus Woesearchaeota archaeon]
MLYEISKDFAKARDIELKDNLRNGMSGGRQLKLVYLKRNGDEFISVRYRDECTCHLATSDLAGKCDMIISLTAGSFPDYMTMLFHDDHIFTNYGVRPRFEHYQKMRKFGPIEPLVVFSEDFRECSKEDIEAVLDCFYPVKENNLNR